MKLLWFGFLITLVACRTVPLSDPYYDNYKSHTSEQLTNLNEESSSHEFIDRDTRYSNENHLTKRDALWTTTEVLDCVRRLKYFRDSSKLDLVTEMLNCYRRLKHTS